VTVAQKGFYFDQTACIGCKTCQIACKDKNDNPIGVLFRQVHTFEGGKFPHPWVAFLSVSCNHCENPRCVQNCPTGASYKRAEDGLVVIDQDLCIGCQYCIWSCPYGARYFIEEKGIVGKCDGCLDLVSQGLNPACVDSCLMRVLEFGDLDELRQKHPDSQVLSLAGVPDADLTGPSFLITPKPEAQR